MSPNPPMEKKESAADKRPERPVRWVRACEAAAYLGVTKSTFFRYLKIGKLPAALRHQLSPRCVVYDLDALDALMEAQPAGRPGCPGVEDEAPKPSSKCQ